MSTSSVTPTQALLQVIVGFWLSRCVYIAAKLGIAEYRSLLAAAGFEMTRVTVTPLELAVLEASPR